MLFYRKARNSCLSHACVLKICFPPSKCSFQEVMPMSCPQPKSPSKCSGNLCFIFISSPLQNVWHDLRAMPPAKRCGQQWIKHRPQGLFSAHRFEVRGNKKIQQLVWCHPFGTSQNLRKCTQRTLKLYLSRAPRHSTSPRLWASWEFQIVWRFFTDLCLFCCWFLFSDKLCCSLRFLFFPKHC